MLRPGRERPMEELVRVAGIPVGHLKECFEEAKGQVGLDQYEVRRWDGWYLAHHLGDGWPRPYLSVIKHPDGTRTKRGLRKRSFEGSADSA